jgi:hypothetical protein
MNFHMDHIYVPCMILTMSIIIIKLLLDFCLRWRHGVFSVQVGKEIANTIVQGDQKVSVHLMITVENTRKNILNSFNHLPWKIS